MQPNTIEKGAEDGLKKKKRRSGGTDASTRSGRDHNDGEGGPRVSERSKGDKMGGCKRRHHGGNVGTRHPENP